MPGDVLERERDVMMILTFEPATMSKSSSKVCFRRSQINHCSSPSETPLYIVPSIPEGQNQIPN